MMIIKYTMSLQGNYKSLEGVIQFVIDRCLFSSVWRNRCIDSTPRCLTVGTHARYEFLGIYTIRYEARTTNIICEGKSNLWRNK